MFVYILGLNLDLPEPEQGLGGVEVLQTECMMGHSVVFTHKLQSV